MVALGAPAALDLVALPLARCSARPGASRGVAAGRRDPVRDVLRDGRFWIISASFGICGFHVGFLAMHMPGVIERCGLPPSLAGTWLAVAGAANIAGSIPIGVLMKR